MIKPFIRHIFVENISYKLLALLISIVLWLFIMTRDDAQQELQLGVDIGLPDNYSLVHLEPDVVDVVVKGNPRLIRRYAKDRPGIKFVIYNTKNTVLRLRLKEEKLDLPFGIQLVSMNPRYIKIEMKETKQ